MKPNPAITYMLTGNNPDSDNYYADIAGFGEYQLQKMQESLGALSDRFIRFILDNKIELIQSREVYQFEALMLGTFWNIYGGYAAGANQNSVWLMQHTALQRRKRGIRKKYADLIRAGFAYRLLENQKNEYLYLYPDTENLKKLINWMKAGGDFHREATRLSIWLSFFENESKTDTFISICILRSFALKFRNESKAFLGEYTRGVDMFVKNIRINRHFREDKISVTRQRNEYHLNMLGAFIYNRSMRAGFLKCRKKVVLLPACMKAQPAMDCKSVPGSWGDTCRGCKRSCLVNKIRLSGLENNFEVEIIKHSSDISIDKTSTSSDTGFVGVACAATVIGGGLELMGQNIPAQCVLLDHSGCKHWTDKPVSTSLNIKELLFRVGIRDQKGPLTDVKKESESQKHAACCS